MFGEYQEAGRNRRARKRERSQVEKPVQKLMDQAKYETIRN